MVRVSINNMPTEYSNLLKDYTGEAGMKEQEWDASFAKKSLNATTGRFLLKAKKV